MTGPIRRMVAAQGTTYTVRNASGDPGGRDVPDYIDDGEITAVIERRGLPRTVTDSGGTEHDTDLELRAVVSGSITIRGVSAGGYPTKLKHPKGTVYRVLHHHTEDGGVAVLTVIEE